MIIILSTMLKSEESAPVVGIIIECIIKFDLKWFTKPNIATKQFSISSLKQSSFRIK